MHTKSFLGVEFFTLFILVPVSLVLPYDFRIKVATVLVAFSYLIFVLFKHTSIRFKIKKTINWSSFLKSTTLKGVIIAVVTAAYVYIVDASALFCVPKSNPLLWVIILLVYSLLSVWPQEVIYRTFFFERYATFFKDKRLFIFINAIVFALAHLFLGNVLVLVLTFLGGLLFAYTYEKTRSTTLVSIEHALYGNWLFTVGMGQMLAFPGMEAC